MEPPGFTGAPCPLSDLLLWLGPEDQNPETCSDRESEDSMPTAPKAVNRYQCHLREYAGVFLRYGLPCRSTLYPIYPSSPINALALRVKRLPIELKGARPGPEGRLPNRQGGHLAPVNLGTRLLKDNILLTGSFLRCVRPSNGTADFHRGTRKFPVGDYPPHEGFPQNL